MIPIMEYKANVHVTKHTVHVSTVTVIDEHQC